MRTFAKRERLRIVREFMDATEAEVFAPHAFLGWLRDQPDHPAHNTFFGMSDEDAADAHRASLVRRWVSDLRISVRYTAPSSSVVRVHMVTVPAFVSPQAGRRNGGGYIATDTSDPDMIAELRQQAADALRSWAERYAGILQIAGGDPVAVDDLARLLEAIENEREAAA